MPFEFWERNLQRVLDRISDLNAAGTPTEFTFCSNLMWKDDRYLDLLRQFKGHPQWTLRSPSRTREWPVRQNMAILPKFLERIEALGECNMLNLVLVMGQGLIDLGPQYIIDTFVKRGISDVTCDMIFPWGSGRSYFDRAQPYYRDVARFIEDLTELGAPLRPDCRPSGRHEEVSPHTFPFSEHTQRRLRVPLGSPRGAIAEPEPNRY